MNPHRDDYYEFSDFRFYPHRGTQLERLQDAAKFALSPQQVKLLILLVKAPAGVAVTYGVIRTEIWPDGESDKNFSHDINTLKSSLAAKFGKDSDEMIETVRRQGYRLKAEATYYPAESGPSPGRSGLVGEPTEDTETEPTTREWETETKAAPPRASFRDHLGHVLISSCLYALLHVLALWIETAYQIERFRSALWVTSPAVFLWCGVTAYVGLFWGWRKKPGDGHGIFGTTLLVFAVSDLLLYFALGWMLPPETVTAAGFQTLTAPAAYLKNLFWFQTLTILYLVLPWQDIVSREREQRSIVSSRLVPSSAMRRKSSNLKLIALAGLLVLALPAITFVTQKGGSGKTTLAINCAVVASQQGKRVLILDMDTQGTAETWYQDRDDDAPQVIKINASELDRALKAAEKQGFDFVLIDTPGRDEPGAAAAIRAADFCVIPCRPSPADLKATPPTIETIRRLNKPAAFVLMQTPPRSFRNREAEHGLSVMGMVCPVHIVVRNVYQDAQGAGLGVTEYDSEGKAAGEVRALWEWILKKLRKVKHGD